MITIIINYYYFIIIIIIIIIAVVVTLRPNAGHGLLVLEVSRSHITTHHSQ